ncbi:MAG: DEAD/DEAH box helicase, partial [Bdellovibrionales bacterium]|nr:DEAD/DEAH box helicase [Bdellovibrionales bacterium]
ATLAGDLIKLYAARSIAQGWRFEPFGAEDERFADSFAFDETADQLKAIEETMQDMASERPMDRLICGDVGFGKTEVAIRAAFKCLQHARQVAVLAPTTLLVEQHCETFTKRLSGYPYRVAALSRLRSSAEKKAILDDLAQGKIDVIVGTHRLLQRDVRFQDLGLFIVDEEHRFGVKQKEKLKQAKRSVDVLSLTATPIPRTLHMSLLGIRDISVISTPPQDRRVIRTYLANHDQALIRDAILREIKRAGQIFYLHNRIDDIELVCSELTKLVPEARFSFAHGQMNEKQLEKIMLAYLRKEFDVLVSTTIIESGLDIPNANTMIIDRADRFGLAQLYQLRGRVGRSERQAYAYLLIPEARKLGAEAQQRLKALQALDDLGLGFNLAIRDLEIRGAGNLLGKEQSGNVLLVGFELYTRILKETVLNLKGELDLIESLDPEVKISINAFIPEFYIPDVQERLLLYQRLAAARSADEINELYFEIEDRFGPVPQEVANLAELMRIRALCRQAGIEKAEFRPNKASFAFTPQAPIKRETLVKFLKESPQSFRLSSAGLLTVSIEEDISKDPAALYNWTSHLLGRVLE